MHLEGIQSSFRTPRPLSIRVWAWFEEEEEKYTELAALFKLTSWRRQFLNARFSAIADRLACCISNCQVWSEWKEASWTVSARPYSVLESDNRS